MARQATEGIEKALWEQVSSMPIETVWEEVEGWIIDPGSTTGRASTHDCLVMLYWVLMNLVTHVAMNIEAKVKEMLEKKEGGLEPSRAWKEHNEECRSMSKKIEALSADSKLLHLKVDQIVACAGFCLFIHDLE